MSQEKTRIWMTDFPKMALEEDLWELFRPFGEVESIAIVRKSPEHPIAFIDMKNPSDALKAINNLNSQIFQGKNITVKKSTQKFHKEKYVYALLSFDKNECYIGETCDPKRRFKQHLNGKGEELSHWWISTLNKKLKPIILEAIMSGYDAEFQAIFLETAWRFVASRYFWDVINPPHYSEIKDKLEEAIHLRMKKWPKILEQALTGV